MQPTRLIVSYSVWGRVAFLTPNINMKLGSSLSEASATGQNTAGQKKLNLNEWGKNNETDTLKKSLGQKILKKKKKTLIDNRYNYFLYIVSFSISI